MHAIAQILSQALTNLGVQLPPWALPAVAIAVFVALLPRLSDNMRSGEACRAVARSRVADGEARAASRLFGDYAQMSADVFRSAERMLATA